MAGYTRGTIIPLFVDNLMMLPHALSRPLRRLLRWTLWTLATVLLVVVLGLSLIHI